MLNHIIVQRIVLGVVALILIVAVLLSWVSGTKAGKSIVVLKDAAAARDGLHFFYNDQGRYPSVTEFQDRNLMLGYFSSYPLPNITGGKCSQTFKYNSPLSVQSFQLDFCLPKASQGFVAGWNKITQ